MPSPPPAPDSAARLLDQVLEARRTEKVLVADPTATPVPPLHDRDWIDPIIAAAGGAPFHHLAPDAKRAGAVEPWRVYALDARSCRALGLILMERGDAGKVPKMLAAATALLQVTWLPEGVSAPGRSPRFEPTLKNMEHIAATAAAVQNMLLAATARGLSSYWGSGGPLAEPEGFALLDIPTGEVLLASVYLFPPRLHGSDGVTVVGGKHRALRSPSTAWSRWVDVAPAEAG